MADDTNVTTSEPEEPQGGVSQAVADDISLLHGEVQATVAHAQKACRTTIIAFVIILLVIAGYLYFIYAMVKDRLTPATVIELVIERGNEVLANAGLPVLNDPNLAETITQTLREKAPEFFESQVKPQVEEYIKKVEENRPKYAEKFEVWFDDAAERGVTRFSQEALPKLAELTLNTADSRLDDLLDELEGRLEEIVQEVVEIHKDSMKNLAPENRAQLTKQLEEAFDERIGGYLDVTVQRIKKHIENAEQAFAELLAKPALTPAEEAKIARLKKEIGRVQSGKLTEADDLTILALQLICDLFEETDISEAGLLGGED